MSIITKGMGAVLKTIKKVKPTLGHKKTRKFKIDAGIKRLNKKIDQTKELYDSQLKELKKK
jgi:hypothetical protein|tara:strand:- start:943 stop:1125 length:183 start_codon:yes stop_codon:yes gene_type:complete